MRLASDINPATPLVNPILGEESTTSPERYADYKIIRRNGSVVGFEPDKIAVAMTKAFLAVSGNTAAASAGVRDKVQALTEAVVQSLRELTKLRGEVMQRAAGELPNDGKVIDDVRKLD